MSDVAEQEEGNGETLDRTVVLGRCAVYGVEECLLQVFDCP